jgi:uncharacterized short protein YbdD (DUF466 family)
MPAPGASRDVAEARGARWRARWDAACSAFRTLLGANGYQNYLEHHRAVHPGEEPLAERDWWKQHWAEQETSPTPRCC